MSRALKLTLLCGVVKRKGFGVGRREVARRQSRDQGFPTGVKGLGSEGREVPIY